MNGWLLAAAVFFACAVEAVEALTVVLAVGVTRGWRSTGLGVLSGLAVLIALVAVLGPALTLIPLSVLRLIVGVLLLVVGLQWLRKAVLRASGHKALHDEASAYTRETAAAGAAGRISRAVISDWYAYIVAGKAVLLEGLEVVFIVISLGAAQHRLGQAAVAAILAIAAVTAVGFAVRRPLAKVPENGIKFVVGVLLTAFGIFWATEGTGVAWPGGDAALPALIGLVLLAALGLVPMAARRAPARAR